MTHTASPDEASKAQPRRERVRRRCRRCGGTGYTGHVVANGMCFGCQGNGVVDFEKKPTAAEIAEATRRQDLVAALRTHIQQNYGRYQHSKLGAAIHHLEDHAPDRYTRMIDALAAGRVNAVVLALQDYFAEAGFTDPKDQWI